MSDTRTRNLEAAAAVHPMPDWLMNFCTTDSRKGFYRSGDGYGLVFTDRGSDRLIVSYDNIASVLQKDTARTPWGYDFVRKSGWSQLGVMTFRPDWFRNDGLLSEMVRLAENGFFARFSEVVMTGTSMGGYAACAFAPLAPGCISVALSPQSTLDPSLVPWETRFPTGRAADWSGLFADAATGAASAKRVFLLYDPLRADDAAHIARFDTPNITRLRMRYADHKTAVFLRRAGLLSGVMREAFEGTLTEARFYELFRDGRQLPWFLMGIRNRIMASNRPHLLPHYIKAVRRLGFENIARSTETLMATQTAADGAQSS